MRGQSRFQATYSIKEHVKRTCKRLMNEEKDRLKKKMVETGLSAEELRPHYFHPTLWEQLLKYWDSEGHKHRSDVRAKNRKKVLTLHSAGAKSFEAVEMVNLLFVYLFVYLMCIQCDRLFINMCQNLLGNDESEQGKEAKAPSIVGPHTYNCSFKKG